jgi:hypothetical protein
MRPMTSRPISFALLLVSGCSSGTVKVPHPDLAVGPTDMSITAPTMLASAQTLTSCLAADATSLYWSDQGGGARILKLPLAGGTPSTIATGGDKPSCVTVDDSGVYYTDSGALMKVPIAGGPAVPLASGQDFVKGAHIVAAGGYVYWITDVYGNVDAYNGKNAIVRVPNQGGAVEIVLANVVNFPGGLAVDSSNVYWSDYAGTFAVPLANAMATPIVFGPASGLHDASFAVGNGHLAQVEVSGVGAGDVVLYRLDGSGKMVLATMVAQPLAVDDKGVYVKEAGALERLALDGSGALLLATQAPRALVLSTASIYFTDGAAIYSLPR